MNTTTNLKISRSIKALWLTSDYRNKVVSGVKLACAKSKALKIIEQLFKQVKENRAV